MVMTANLLIAVKPGSVFMAPCYPPTLPYVACLVQSTAAVRQSAGSTSPRVLLRGLNFWAEVSIVMAMGGGSASWLVNDAQTPATHPLLSAELHQPWGKPRYSYEVRRSGEDGSPKPSEPEEGGGEHRG